MKIPTNAILDARVELTSHQDIGTGCVGFLTATIQDIFRGDALRFAPEDAALITVISMHVGSEERFMSGECLFMPATYFNGLERAPQEFLPTAQTCQQITIVVKNSGKPRRPKCWLEGVSVS